MFIATDLQIRIANDRLEELRRHAAQRRRVRLVRRAVRTKPTPNAVPPVTLDDRSRQPIGDPSDDVRVGCRLTPTPSSRPLDIVLGSRCSTEGRAA